MGVIRDNLQRNIGYYLSFYNMSQKDLADKLGVSQSAVTNWIKGKNSPDIELVAELCNIFGVSITDLMGMNPSSADANSEELSLLTKYRQLDSFGRESVRLLADVEYRRCTSPSAVPSAPAVPNNIRSFGGCFPNFGYASAGTGTMAQEEPLDWSYEFDPPKGATCTITIKGDSMEPRFSDGETVWVDTTKLVEPGQIGVFVINGDAYCKKFVRDEKGPRLVSLNPAYDPIVLSEDDEVRLFGRVIGK